MGYIKHVYIYSSNTHINKFQTSKAGCVAKLRPLDMYSSPRPGRLWCNDDCVWLDEGRCVPGDEETRYEDRCMDANTRGGTALRANHLAVPDLTCTCIEPDHARSILRRDRK